MRPATSSRRTALPFTMVVWTERYALHFNQSRAIPYPKSIPQGNSLSHFNILEPGPNSWYPFHTPIQQKLPAVLIVLQHCREFGLDWIGLNWVSGPGTLSAFPFQLVCLPQRTYKQAHIGSENHLTCELVIRSFSLSEEAGVIGMTVLLRCLYVPV